MVPSSVRWLDGRASDRNSYYEQAIESAVRAHDPFQKTIGRWIIRRLSPDSNPVDITLIPKVHDEETLLHAMGSEAANVHLGTKRQVKNILKAPASNETGLVEFGGQKHGQSDRARLEALQEIWLSEIFVAISVHFIVLTDIVGALRLGTLAGAGFPNWQYCGFDDLSDVRRSYSKGDTCGIRDLNTRSVGGLLLDIVGMWPAIVDIVHPSNKSTTHIVRIQIEVFA